MKASTLRTAVLALAAATSAAAFAQAPAGDTPRTRQQVLAELAEAQRQGTLPAAGELALRAPEAPASSSLTREQVRADVLRSRGHGVLLAAGEQVPATAQPSPALAVAGKTRAQVKEEVAEARRQGELVLAGDTAALMREVAGRSRPAPVNAAPTIAAR